MFQISVRLRTTIIGNSVGLCVCSLYARLKIVCRGKEDSGIFGGFTLYGGGLGVVVVGQCLFVELTEGGVRTYVPIPRRVSEV